MFVLLCLAVHTYSILLCAAVLCMVGGARECGRTWWRVGGKRILCVVQLLVSLCTCSSV